MKQTVLEVVEDRLQGGQLVTAEGKGGFFDWVLFFHF